MCTSSILQRTSRRCFGAYTIFNAGPCGFAGVNVVYQPGDPAQLIRVRLERMLEECAGLRGAVSAAAVEAVAL